jgi:hypothetical protein
MTFQTFAFSGRSEMTYGLSLVLRSIQAHGHKTEVFGRVAKVPVLLSLYWLDQVFDLIRWRIENGIGNTRRILAGGNLATCYPNAVLPFVSEVYLGDGDFWDGESKEHVVAKTDDAKAICVAPSLRPIRFEDVQQNRRTFCEMSRGCKNRCLFCQYGWVKPYRESDIADIMAIIDRAETKSVRMFAADRFQHSHYPAIRAYLDKRGKCDTGSDVSARFVAKNPQYLAFTNKVRVGIEGMSERLRRGVNKPMSDDEIIEFVGRVVAAGIKSLDFYMIYGLPGEGESDWLAFTGLLERIERSLSKSYTLAIHWNAFTPASMTPMQWSASAFGYPKKMEAAVMSAQGFKHLKIMHKPRLTGDATLNKRMLAIRGSDATHDLMIACAKNQTLFGQSDWLQDKFREASGFDLHGELPFDAVLPWDKYVKYDKEPLVNAWQRSMSKFTGHKATLEAASV